MTQSYVCSGAKMICSFGDKVAALNVFPDRTVYLAGKPMANVSDHISLSNIQCFGKCHTTSFPDTGYATSSNHGKLIPMPCVPGTISDWIEGKKDYIIKGKSAVLSTSYCKCKWGGTIRIIFDGQNPKDFDEEYINRLLQDAFKQEENEQQEEKHPWLDAAEYIPVIGSIIGVFRAAQKGNWGMWALNMGFLALDILGLFTFGTTTVASTAAKAGVKATTKAVAKQVAKETVINAATDATISKSIDTYNKIKQ